jgi:hypothetical protein
MKYHNKEVTRFFKRLIVLVVAVVMLDFLIGKTLKHFFFTQKYNPLTYAMNYTRQDVLIFGSSRAHRQYIPSVFENKLHLTCYNCGRDGAYLIFNLALVSPIIERYTPKHIVIDITPDEFSTSEEGTLSPLLPYYGNNIVKPFLLYNSQFEKFKLWSDIYPYNSLLGIIIVNNLTSRHVPAPSDLGYSKLDGIMPPHPKAEFRHEKIINERIELLNNFLIKSHKKNINVTLVISPVYYSFSPNDKVVTILDSLCRRYANVNFINYENSPLYNDNKLFKDEVHLNDFGSNKFSADLAEKMAKN